MAKCALRFILGAQRPHRTGSVRVRITHCRQNMKKLKALAAILVCLGMPALALVPDQDDWTVVTMAPDGSWGSATEPSVGQAWDSSA